MEIIKPFVILIVCFAILAKSADFFVDAAVGLAKKFSIPKIIVGIFLVGLATTAPELAVSMMSALRGKPEIAFGNAIGSIICDDGIALAAAGIFSISAIAVLPYVLKTAGLFLVFVDILAFIFVIRDNTLGRLEGGILLVAFFIYTFYMFKKHKKGKNSLSIETDISEKEEDEKDKPVHRLILLFILGLAGIIIPSHFIITSAVHIATFFNIPETVIALTLIALGTSIPEIATCIIAARKGEGEIAVGNIIGADILNICWVAGASAIVNPLTIGRRELLFMFPAMFVMVLSMLIMMRMGYKLKRIHGIILFILYIVYLVLLFSFFPPQIP